MNYKTKDRHTYSVALVGKTWRVVLDDDEPVPAFPAYRKQETAQSALDKWATRYGLEGDKP